MILSYISQQSIGVITSNFCNSWNSHPPTIYGCFGEILVEIKQKNTEKKHLGRIQLTCDSRETGTKRTLDIFCRIPGESRMDWLPSGSMWSSSNLLHERVDYGWIWGANISDVRWPASSCFDHYWMIDEHEKGKQYIFPDAYTLQSEKTEKWWNTVCMCMMYKPRQPVNHPKWRRKDLLHVHHTTAEHHTTAYLYIVTNWGYPISHCARSGDFPRKRVCTLLLCYCTYGAYPLVGRQSTSLSPFFSMCHLPMMWKFPNTHSPACLFIQSIGWPIAFIPHSS